MHDSRINDTIDVSRRIAQVMRITAQAWGLPRRHPRVPSVLSRFAV
ncbi:MAG: hypothetical protein JSS56_18770 [Proteobacteria bacterium]|nr:hypothetical protein [Pseudomonadota bacterium]